MTQDSMPWTGITTGDAGPYSALEWTRIWRNIMGVAAGAGTAGDSGVLWGSGVAPDPGLTVTPNSPAGQSVIVTAGAALVNGTFYFSDASVVLAVAANASGNPRIDTIVLRKDFLAQTVRLVVKQGTPAASPVPPGMTQSASTWEIPIADLTLANGYLTITAALIAQRFMWANAGAFDVIDNVVNASGATVVPGDVMVWAGSAGQVTSNASQGVPVAGVAMNRASNGGYIRLLRRGMGYVKLSNASAALGGYVVHDANFSGKVPASGSSLWNAFAITREITGGAGLCLCYVDVTQPKPKSIALATYATPADINSASTSYVDIDTTNLAISVDTSTGIVLTRFIMPVYFNHAVGTAWMHFNIQRDATTDATTSSQGLLAYNSGASVGDGVDGGRPVILDFLWTGLTPGSHTFRPRWKSVLGSATSPVMGIRAAGATNGFTVRMEAIEQEKS